HSRVCSVQGVVNFLHNLHIYPGGQSLLSNRGSVEPSVDRALDEFTSWVTLLEVRVTIDLGTNRGERVSARCVGVEEGLNQVSVIGERREDSEFHLIEVRGENRVVFFPSSNSHSHQVTARGESL